MQQIVVFTPNNARIYYGSPDDFLGHPSFAVDPDLSKVRGLPPHCWKLVGGEIVPLSPDEMTAREAHIEKHGAINDPWAKDPQDPMPTPSPKEASAYDRLSLLILTHSLAFAVGAALAYFLRR